MLLSRSFRKTLYNDNHCTCMHVCMLEFDTFGLLKLQIDGSKWISLKNVNIYEVKGKCLSLTIGFSRRTGCRRGDACERCDLPAESERATERASV